MPFYADVTEDEINYSEVTNKGNIYRPYHFGRNFAVRDLQLAGFLTYAKNGPIKLTEKGSNADLDSLDAGKDVYDVANDYYKTHPGSKAGIPKPQKSPAESTEELEEASNAIAAADWQDDILQHVKSLSPGKFESFCRGLLQKMGFEINPEKGHAISGDGGIDGFCYSFDRQSLKTTRVVIQCKRYNDAPVGSPEINALRGAIDTHRADYGIFITTSYFSHAAKQSSREGSTPITLIDGGDLVQLMVDYDYKVHKIYAADEDYFKE